MNKLRVCETTLAGALALAMACPHVFGAPPAAPVPAVKTAKPAPPAAPAPVKVIVPVKAAVPTPVPAVKAPTPSLAAKPVAPAAAADPKSAEAQLISAQAQVVAGNLDAGLKTLQAALVKAAPALAPRVAFVEKLVAIRVADRLGDQAKVAVGLAEAMKQAAHPDQVAACWQLGLGLTQAAVAAKSPAATGLLDFLGTQAAPAMRQSGPHVELARLDMAAGRAAAAEAELTKAAAQIGSVTESAAWTAAVAELAKAVDAGQAPKAGADLFERLHKAAPPAVQSALNVVEGRALLARGELAACQAVFERAVGVGKASKEQALASLTLGYDLSAALSKAGNAAGAAEVLAKAEAFAESLPASSERDQVLVAALVGCGQADRAADLAWKAALAAKLPTERQQMLSLYVNAAVAAGQEAAIVPKLQSMKAPAGIYTAAAEALAKSGKTQAALAMVEAVPAQAVVGDAKAAADVASVMHQIHQQRKQTAARQAARCRAVAAECAAAAKKAEAAKDAPKAAAHAKQAAAFQALATEIEK